MIIEGGHGKMVVKIHFETLTSGMKAKLGPGYKGRDNSVPNLRRSYGNDCSAGLIKDSVGHCRRTLVSKDK